MDDYVDLQTLPASDPDSGRENAGRGGRWQNGCPPGPGRRKRDRLKDAINDQYDEKPTEFMYARAAESLLMQPGQVPEFDNIMKLQVWVFMMKALGGSSEHAKELNDRTDPKPSRAHVEIKLPRAAAGTSDVSDEDAENYYRRLHGGDDG